MCLAHRGVWGTSSANSHNGRQPANGLVKPNECCGEGYPLRAVSPLCRNWKWKTNGWEAEIAGWPTSTPDSRGRHLSRPSFSIRDVKLRHQPNLTPNRRPSCPHSHNKSRQAPGLIFVWFWLGKMFQGKKSHYSHQFFYI